MPALLPFLAERFDLGYAATAGIMLAATISSSLVQPLFGLVSDRRGAMWLLPAGVFVAAVGITGAGLAPSYPLALLAVAVGGMGVAAYHPEGAKFASFASGVRRASGMAYFNIGGNTGYALGPIVITPIVLGARAGRDGRRRAAGGRRSASRRGSRCRICAPHARGAGDVP